jgi:diguanylate cyclase (GGDEF)-like protein
MLPQQLTRRAEKQVAELMTERGLDANLLLPRLRELRSRENVAACSIAVRVLARLELTEEAAERLLEELHEHRKTMGNGLGRDPGLQVAAIDFLNNVKKLLNSPAVIEIGHLERAERDAMTDPLTGLFNRRYFRRQLDVELRRGTRHNFELSLLILDLDYFKSVNDIYGHAFGDRVIRRAGRILRRAVRESDIACRFGGDELVVVLPETDRLGAFTVAERIRRRIETRFTAAPIGDRLVAMTVSGGLATFPDDGATAEALIDCADQALYLAKSRGRNGIVIHHSERRRAVRFPVRPSARAEIAPIPGAGLAPVQAINLSRTGALLAGDWGDPPTGTVELTLWEASQRWIVPGRVVRVEGGGTRRFAVAFDQPLSDRCLERSILYVPPGRPEAGGPM